MRCFLSLITSYNLVFFIGLHSDFLLCTALRQIILSSGTLLKDDVHKVNVKVTMCVWNISFSFSIADSQCVTLCSVSSPSVSMTSCCRCVFVSSSNRPAALPVNQQGASVGSTAAPSPDRSCTGAACIHQISDRFTSVSGYYKMGYKFIRARHPS